MPDSLSIRAIEGRTYSYLSGPAPDFQIVNRLDGWAERRGNMLRSRIEGMLKAEAEGDTKLMLGLADQAVGWIMQARDEMEKRALGTKVGAA